jgi:hypothetical protein
MNREFSLYYDKYAINKFKQCKTINDVLILNKNVDKKYDYYVMLQFMKVIRYSTTTNVINLLQKMPNCWYIWKDNKNNVFLSIVNINKKIIHNFIPSEYIVETISKQDMKQYVGIELSKIKMNNNICEYIFYTV